MAFNELTDAQAERLALLSEEAGEVVQAVGKILRHGYHSTDPTKRGGETNRQALERELGDILATLELMTDAMDVRMVEVAHHKEGKLRRVAKYLHHQPVAPEFR